MKSRTISKCRGFMLIEMVIILTLLSFVLSLGIYFNMDNFRSYSYHSDRDLLISLLQRARSQAQNGLCHTPACNTADSYGIYIQSDTFTLFEGDTFNSSIPADNQIFEANPSITHAGLQEIVFEKNSGNALSPGMVSLIDATGRISTITIRSEGQISWTN